VKTREDALVAQCDFDLALAIVDLSHAKYGADIAVSEQLDYQTRR